MSSMYAIGQYNIYKVVPLWVFQYKHETISGKLSKKDYCKITLAEHNLHFMHS